MGSPENEKIATAIAIGAVTGGVGAGAGASVGNAAIAGGAIAGGGYTALRAVTKGPKIPKQIGSKAQARQLNIDPDTSKSRSRDLLKKRRRSFATRTSQANIRKSTLGGA